MKTCHKSALPVTFPDISNQEKPRSLQSQWNNTTNTPRANLLTHKSETCLLPFDRCSSSGPRVGRSANAFLMSTANQSFALKPAAHTYRCSSAYCASPRFPPPLHQRNKRVTTLFSRFHRIWRIEVCALTSSAPREYGTEQRTEPARLKMCCTSVNVLHSFCRQRQDFYLLPI